MSAYSGLLLFSPASSSKITFGDIRDWTSELRTLSGVNENSRGSIKLKFGESIDQDPLSEAREKHWDYKVQDAQWDSLWPDVDALFQQPVSNAYVDLGSLEHSMSKALAVMQSQDAEYEWIAPDSISFRVGPVCAGTVDMDRDQSVGAIEISFWGYGFFGWQPTQAFWEHYRNCEAFTRIREWCRKTLPVHDAEAVSQASDHLGDLFMNRSDYQDGDWMVSIDET